MLLLLNVISREYFWEGLSHIYLNDSETAIKVVTKFAGNDEELGMRLFRIIIEASPKETD